MTQQHAQVLVVHVFHMLHQGWPPQALSRAAGIEGTDIGGHQPQALIHGLPHLRPSAWQLAAEQLVADK